MLLKIVMCYSSFSLVGQNPLDPDSCIASHHISQLLCNLKDLQPRLQQKACGPYSQTEKFIHCFFKMKLNDA